MADTPTSIPDGMSLDDYERAKHFMSRAEKAVGFMARHWREALALAGNPKGGQSALRQFLPEFHRACHGVPVGVVLAGFLLSFSESLAKYADDERERAALALKLEPFLRACRLADIRDLAAQTGIAGLPAENDAAGDPPGRVIAADDDGHGGDAKDAPVQ